jgi:branched-chain amino acid transport system ATP-binding protein
VKPTGGQVEFHGQDYRKIAAQKIVASGCSLVPEGRQVFATMSVEENLILGGYVLQKKEGRGAVQKELYHQYELFPVLKERSSQLAGTLSGGEQQMLAMGRALMSRPNCPAAR